MQTLSAIEISEVSGAGTLLGIQLPLPEFLGLDGINPDALINFLLGTTIQTISNILSGNAIFGL
jgi:hypothetical protein